MMRDIDALDEMIAAGGSDRPGSARPRIPN